MPDVAQDRNLATQADGERLAILTGDLSDQRLARRVVSRFRQRMPKLVIGGNNETSIVTPPRDLRAQDLSLESPSQADKANGKPAATQDQSHSSHQSPFHATEATPGSVGAGG